MPDASPPKPGVNPWYLLAVVRRRLPIVIACVVLVPAAAIAFSLTQEKKYTAKAVLQFRDPEFDQKLFGTSFSTPSDPDREAATNNAQVSLPRVAALTAARLPRFSQDDVSSAVSVETDAKTDLVSVRATDTRARFAAKLANTFGKQYIAFRRAADRAPIRSAMAPLRRQIAALPRDQRSGELARSLRERLRQLSVLSSLQTGNVELLQLAEAPREPSSPKPVLNAALGLFFGLLLAAGLVALAEALDRRLRDRKDVEAIFDRPLLAALPEDAPPSSYQILRANLDHLTPDEPLRSIAITSALAEEGKSTVAAALATAEAQAGKTTLLVECDLYRPILATRMGVPGEPGLGDYLAGAAKLAESTHELPLPPTAAASNNGPSAGHGPTESGRLSVMFAGRSRSGDGTLLGSRRFRDFLATVRQLHDVVILDCSPLLPVVDTLELIPQVDAVLLCVRTSRTTRNQAQAARDALGRLPARPTGIVLTGVRPKEDEGYSYYYSEEYATQAR